MRKEHRSSKLVLKYLDHLKRKKSSTMRREGLKLSSDRPREKDTIAPTNDQNRQCKAEPNWKRSMRKAYNHSQLLYGCVSWSGVQSKPATPAPANRFRVRSASQAPWMLNPIMHNQKIEEANRHEGCNGIVTCSREDWKKLTSP